MTERGMGLAGCLVLLMCVALPSANADTLQRVRDSGTFRIGHRLDAAPFSYRNTIGEPAGMMVEICRQVAAAVKAHLALESISVQYVPVTAENRFDAVQESRIDILCGPTTVTLSRRERVDFSLFTFVDGASVLFRVGGPDSFEALAGHKIGVRAGTTTEEALNNTVAELGVNLEVVAVESHDDGLARLEAGTVSAYFADRAILVSLLAGSRDPAALKLSRRYFSYEPYALALPRGDDDFRLLVDRTLSQLYRSGGIYTLFANAFGADAEPTEVLRSLYLVNGIAQ